MGQIEDLAQASQTGQPDIARFGAIIGDIYECALNPALWPATLDHIREAVGGTVAWIAVHYPGQVRSVYEIEVGTDPHEQERLRTHYVAASPFIGAVNFVMPGDIRSVDDVIDYGEFLEGRFHREWAGPQGFHDFLMGVLAREADRFVWLGIGLPHRAEPEQKARMAQFLPHVERALRISDLLDQKEAKAETLAKVFAALDSGMLLVDATLGVQGINEAARDLLAESGSLRIERDRLVCERSAAGEKLLDALRACAESRADAGGASVLFESRDGELDLMVHVMPLLASRVATPNEPVAALFLARPDAPHRPPVQAVVDHYGLTPSETRILLALMEGKSPNAIAAAQGVSIATVRTHLRRLYDKTGTSGQVDIVRLTSQIMRGV